MSGDRQEGPAARPRAVAWDPKSPSTLILLSEGEMSYVSSDDGIGCNRHEAVALLEIMDVARPSDEELGHNAVQRCRGYRKALRKCMESWQEDLLTSQKDDDEQDGEMASCNLLKIDNAILHLVEIYLLKVKEDQQGEDHADYHDPKQHDAAWLHHALPAGYWTSDTVRYLREHHLLDPFTRAEEEYLPQPTDQEQTAPSIVRQMLEAPQPEFFHVPGGNDGDQDSPATLYWDIVFHLVLQGRLKEVWALLCRHSACRRALPMQQDDGEETDEDFITAQDREGFLLLRVLLLTAPLPGGLRSDDSPFTAQEEPADTIPSLVPGLTAFSHLLWETSSEVRTATRDRMNTIPPYYHWSAAASAHTKWQECLSQVITATEGSHLYPLKQLSTRIPQLRAMLAVMGGNPQALPTNTASATPWAQVLLLELLYSRPALRPTDLPVRTRVAMRNVGDPDSNWIDEVIAAIMGGNAGRAVNALHLYGGDSGAALPATVTALVCELLANANLLPKDSAGTDITSDLILAASSAIVSSFVQTADRGRGPSMGMRLALRLLLPYVTPRNVVATATAAEFLDHYWPRSDAEVRGLLSLCQDAMSRGSIRMVQGCESLTLCRYNHYREKSESRPGAATFWLLRGLECWLWSMQDEEGAVSGDGLLDTCSHRHFLTLCDRAVNTILKAILLRVMPTHDVDDVDTDGKDARMAEGGETWTRDDDLLDKGVATVADIVEAIAEEERQADPARNEVSIGSIVGGWKEVQLLKTVAAMERAHRDSQYETMATHIVECLQDKPYGPEGAVLTLAYPHHYVNLLALAWHVLQRDAGDSEKLTTSSFTVEGIRVLLKRFTELAVEDTLPIDKDFDEAERAKWLDRLPGAAEGLRLALAEGLMRAFVRENAEAKIKDEDLWGPVEEVSMQETVERVLSPDPW